MKMLTVDDYTFRKVVEACDGVGLRAAEQLGVSPQAVSARLNSERHLHWWKQFKRNKRKSAFNNVPSKEEKTVPVQEIIDRTNLKLRELVIKFRGDLHLVALELGIPKGANFVEEYLNSDNNREWWSLCRFNPEKSEHEEEEPSALEKMQAQIQKLQEELNKCKKIISLYETAHKLAFSSLDSTDSSVSSESENASV